MGVNSVYIIHTFSFTYFKKWWVTLNTAVYMKLNFSMAYCADSSIVHINCA